MFFPAEKLTSPHILSTVSDMKKVMTLLAISILITTTAFAMGERVEQKKTVNGTPIFEQAPLQYAYAQNKLATLEQVPSAANMKPAVFAFYDFRELFPNETALNIRSYFYEAKSYYLGDEFSKFNEVFAQFIGKNTVTSINADLQAEGVYLSGRALQKQASYREAIPMFEKVEKEFPRENTWIIEAKREQASCYQTIGNVSESITVLEDTLKKYPLGEYELASFNLNIGLAYKKLGNIPFALEAFQRVNALPETPKNKGPKLAAKLMYESLQKAQ